MMTVDKLIGRHIDEYRVDRLLGYGGMGRVYLATDVQVQRQVALKITKTSFRADQDYAERFKREAQAIARLEHPHIIRLYRYGEARGMVYMAMQYVEGTDLATVLAAYRKARDYIDLREVEQIVQDICSALDYAHQQGVIHRDVKPSNILLDAQGRAYLADFGLARLVDVSTRGTAFGSAHYMSPEQAILSATVVPQSDLYSLGVVLYEILTGKVPFDADVPSDIVIKHMEETPRPMRRSRARIAPELEGVVMKALAKRPEDRQPDGATLAADLQRASETVLAQTPGDSPTLLSRASITQRIREETINPLPPIPAAVIEESAAIDAPLPVHTAEPAQQARFFRGRRLAVYVISAAVLVLLAAGALLAVNPFGEETDPVGNVCQDSDHDCVIDDEDRCPDVAGLAVMDGCELSGFVTARSNVNMRAGPGMGYDVRGVLYPSEGVVILGRNVRGPDDVWLYVRPRRLDAEDAWVSADLIKMNVPLESVPEAGP